VDGYSPIRGKCFYWREQVDDGDRYNTRVKPEDWQVECTCFVEGTRWLHTVSTVPADCPQKRHCRYYIYYG